MTYQILGAVVVKGVLYEDDQIAKLKDCLALGPYGSGWVYGGNQLFEESCIVITDKYEGVRTYGGRLGLPNALAKLRAI